MIDLAIEIKIEIDLEVEIEIDLEIEIEIDLETLVFRTPKNRVSTIRVLKN